MCPKSKRTHCFWSALLSITVSVCVSLLYIYLQNKDKYEAGYTVLPEDISFPEKLSDSSCVPVCDTKECLSYAKNLLRNMKPEADPCENSHTFACGAYEEKFSAEESGTMHHDTETNMFKVVDDIMRNIQADTESASGKLKTVYDSCMDYVSTEKHALPTAQKFLGDIGMPDWPNLASDFQFRNIDIPTILGSLKGRGELLFLTFVVRPSTEFSYDYPPLNQTYNMTVQIDLRYFNSLLLLPKESAVFHILDYFDLDSESIEEIWDDYKAVRSSILKLEEENCRRIDEYIMCGPFEETEVESCKFPKYACDPYQDSKLEVYSLGEETDCRQLNLTCSDTNDDSADVCKFAEVFLNSSGLSDRFNKDFLIIDPGDVHIVTRIIPVLKNFTDRAVANFFALNFYLSHLEELNFYFQLTRKTCFPYRRCQIQKPVFVLDRWRVCTEWLIENMQLAVEYEFQKKFLTLQENERVIEFFDECKSELAEVLSRQDWLSVKDKDALDFQNLTFNLEHLKGYQERPKNYEHSIDEYYKTFSPKVGNFFHNAVELRRTSSDIHLLLSPINKYLHSMKFEKQASYSCGNVVYHFGKLVPPQYVPGLPRLLNLLLFTVFGGHEIGHYIDETIQVRKGERECLIDQYSQFKYEFADENLDGSQFIPENFADNIYSFLIDRFIEKYVSAHEDVLLPGFPYSSRQIFYIAVTQPWCEKSAENSVYEQLFKKGVRHPPIKLRSVGPMQNSKGFSEAFSCPEGSYMNPRTKCSILDDV